MRRTPIAHILFPRANATRPVPEFAWAAARALYHTPDLDVTVVMPVPVKSMRALHSRGRRRRGASGWPTDLERRLRDLEPRPILVPYVPVPRRSTEMAAAAIGARLFRGPRAQRPAVVQGSFLDEGGYVATRVAHALGTKSLVVAHGTDVRAALGEVPGVGRTRRSLAALRGADHVVAVSHQLAQDLARLGCRAEVLPFTSSAGVFRLAPFQPRGGPEILFVGRVSRAKGAHLLIESLAKVSRKDATVKLVGPVVDVDVDGLASRFGVAERVKVAGEVTQDELPKIYRKATCLALPSAAEGLPCVLVESLLVGRPVVATQVGGIAELVTPRVGVLLDRANPTALARALDQVIEQAAGGLYSPDELRAHAMPYAWESVGPRLAASVRRLVA